MRASGGYIHLPFSSRFVDLRDGVVAPTFGTKCVSAKTMTETLFKNMKLYIDFEIDHRNSITSTDMHHICTNFCTEDLKKYEIKWKKENSADNLEDILSEDDMVETIELEETVNKIPDNANKSK